MICVKEVILNAYITMIVYDFHCPDISVIIVLDQTRPEVLNNYPHSGFRICRPETVSSKWYVTENEHKTGEANVFAFAVH